MQEKVLEWYYPGGEDTRTIIIGYPPEYKWTPWGYLYTDPITGEMTRNKAPKERVILIKY